jgi:hypothetical protein
MEAMYHRMADAVHARDPRAFLAVGTRFCPTYIYFFDLMVQFARNWSEYQTDYTPPSWMPANSPQRFCHFVHSVPSSEAGAALSRAMMNGAGWVFVTDQVDPNPWGVLPLTSTRSWPRCTAPSDAVVASRASRDAPPLRDRALDPCSRCSRSRRTPS